MLDVCRTAKIGVLFRPVLYQTDKSGDVKGGVLRGPPPPLLSYLLHAHMAASYACLISILQLFSIGNRTFFVRRLLDVLRCRGMSN
jgi:hypothetical protein